MPLSIGMGVGIGRGEGVVFSPKAIANLRAWYDFTDLSTLYQDAAATTPVASDGDVIGYVADKSGNGYHATQNTTGFKPVWKGGGYGLPDGVDDVLPTSIPTGGSLSGLSIVFVTDPTQSAAHQAHTDKYHPLIGAANQVEGYLVWRSFTSQPGAGYFINCGAFSFTPTQAGFSDTYLLPAERTAPTFVAMVAGTSQLLIYTDGVLRQSKAVSCDTVRNSQNMRLFSTTGYSEMPCYLAFVYHAKLTSTDIANLYSYSKGYLATKGVSVT